MRKYVLALPTLTLALAAAPAMAGERSDKMIAEKPAEKPDAEERESQPKKKLTRKGKAPVVTDREGNSARGPIDNLYKGAIF